MKAEASEGLALKTLISQMGVEAEEPLRRGISLFAVARRLKEKRKITSKTQILNEAPPIGR